MAHATVSPDAAVMLPAALAVFLMPLVTPTASGVDTGHTPVGATATSASPPGVGADPQDRPPSLPEDSASHQFDWPLDPPPTVLRPFTGPAVGWGPGHRGADLLASPGSPVRAAGGGTVTFAGPVAGRGVVTVQHVDGFSTTYEPVQPVVSGGTVVRRGQVIARLVPGHPGCSAPAPGACLHWGARRGTVYLDPLRLLSTGHVRLLPWREPSPHPLG